MVLDLKGVQYETNEFKVLTGATLDLVKYTLLKSCTTIVGGSQYSSPFRICSNTFTELDAEVDSELTTLGSYCLSQLSVLKSVDFSNCKKLLSISNRAFYGNPNLETVKLPPNLERFENSCFQECSRLQPLDVPDSVYFLGIWFIRSTGMTEIHISPNSNISEIDTEAIKLTKLTSFYIAKNVTYLDGSIFMMSYQLTELVLHPENKNFKQVGTELYSPDGKTFLLTRKSGEITIPKTVEILAMGCFRGTKITKIIFEKNQLKEIGDWFCCENDVAEFTYPAGITNVSAHAFADSDKLTTVVLTDEIKIIEENAFEMCDGLQTIELRNVQEIHEAAFNRCSNLKIIVIPATVTIIEPSAFSQIKNLTVDCSLNDNFEIVRNMFFKDRKQVLSEYFGTEKTDIVIPSHCTKIDKLAFAKKNIGKVTFEGSTSMAIMHYAFEESKITEIELPSTLTGLSSECFSSCKSLHTVTFNGGSITVIPSYCFSYCNLLTTINIPSTIKTISDNAFYGCSSITNIDFNSLTSLETISNNAFTNSGIQSAVFPSSLKLLGKESFQNTPLESIDMSQCENLSIIPESCFRSNENLVTVKFSANTSDIKMRAFADCIGLTTITLPYEIIYVRMLAFENCSELTTVSLTKNCMLEMFEGRAFAKCPKLNKIEVAKDDEKFIFLNGALMSADKTNFIFFLPSSKVRVYVVPATVKNIGPYAFEGCNNLRMITIPDETIRTIQFSAFANCKRLQFIYLPVSITAIGNSAFEGCSRFKCGSIYTNDDERINGILKETGVNPIFYSSYCEGQKSLFCRDFSHFRISLILTLFMSSD